MATVKGYGPDYPYGASPSGQYVLSRDGIEIMRGTEGETWQWLQRNQSSSVSYALPMGRLSHHADRGMGGSAQWLSLPRS